MIRRTALVLSLAVVCALPALLAGPGMASVTSRHLALPSRLARGSDLSLSRAPAGLRAAVRSTLRLRPRAAGSAFQTGELTASDGASGDEFGWTVAIYGITAVVGAPYKNSSTGAAYVFVHSSKGWSQQAELTASDGAANDQFGSSVAIYGSTAVVGAPFNNSGAGAAYVFVQSGSSWSQQAKLTASDGASGDQFGSAVAIYGTTALVGAPGNSSSSETSTGAAYVFAQSDSTWSQQAELTASDAAANDYFGWSVAISGSTAVVGALGVDSDTGAAYVFVQSDSTWSQQAELTASDGAQGDYLGCSVAIYGSVAVVGAYGNNSNTGAAYVFVHSSKGWSQQAELTATDGTPGDYFGASVAIYRSTAVVGAPYENSSKGATYVGAAYVFVRSGRSWPQQTKLTASDAASGDQLGSSVALYGSTAVVGAYGNSSNTGAAYAFVVPCQEAKLTASDGASGDQFGSSVALYGSTAVVGAPYENSSTGAAYVFVESGTKWAQQAKLTASDGASDDQFGSSVALYGSTAVIGAPGKNSKLKPNIGAAYVFTESGTTWSQQAELTASDPATGDHFGASAAIYPTTYGPFAVVGAPGKNSNAGAAYVFHNPGKGWSQQAELTASDGATGDDFGISVAMNGSNALVGADGNNSDTGAAYVFVGSNGKWSQQAKLTASDGATGDDFGRSVALYGALALVGAPGKSSATGAAYVFEHSSNAWPQQAKLTASDGATGDDFGRSVTMYSSAYSSLAVVGAPGKNSGAGAAYAFVRSSEQWSQQAKLTASNAASGDDFGGSLAVSPSTALVGAPLKSSSTGAAYVFVNL